MKHVVSLLKTMFYLVCDKCTCTAGIHVAQMLPHTSTFFGRVRRLIKRALIAEQSEAENTERWFFRFCMQDERAPLIEISLITKGDLNRLEDNHIIDIYSMLTICIEAKGTLHEGSSAEFGSIRVRDGVTKFKFLFVVLLVKQ